MTLHPTQRMTRTRTPLPPPIPHHIAFLKPLLPVKATSGYPHFRHLTINQRVWNIEKKTCAIRDKMASSNNVLCEETLSGKTRVSSDF